MTSNGSLVETKDGCLSIKNILLVSCLAILLLLKFSINSKHSLSTIATDLVSQTLVPSSHVKVPRLRRMLGDTAVVTLPNVTVIAERGVALCTGTKMIPDALAVIDQFRNVFHSNLTFAILHCDEFGGPEINAFQGIPNLQIMDICAKSPLFGMSEEMTRKRLRSWFCKSAALILAPFHEVMVVDLDTIWLKNPDILFDAPNYLQSGTLYMRDRMSHDRRKKSAEDRVFQDLIHEFVHEHNPNITISKEYAEQQLEKNGVSFFWRNSADPNEPGLNNFQDSSCVIVDKRKHPILQQVIANIIPNFNLGWGDKEMYWIASIISGEDWSFEPFLGTLYGSCGLIAHYDPNAILKPGPKGDYAEAELMYVNGEWLLEKIKSIGHDVDYDMPNAVPAARNTTLFNIFTQRGCGCPFMGCRPMPYSINQYVLRLQWERKTRGINHAQGGYPNLPLSEKPVREHNYSITVYEPDPSKVGIAAVVAGGDPKSSSFVYYNTSQVVKKTWFVDLTADEISHIITDVNSRCVVIFRGEDRVVNEISDMIATQITRKECGKFGCTHTPILLDYGYRGGEAMCVPVSFNPNGPEPILKYLMAMIQAPPPKKQLKEGDIIRGTGSRSIYLYKDGVLRGFPNGDTFAKMGFDFGQVHVLFQNEVDYMQKGPDLPIL